jgi:hypothetical protein
MSTEFTYEPTTEELEQQQPQAAPEAAHKTLLDHAIEYTVQGRTKPVRLTVAQAMKYHARPTKQGHLPDANEVVSFLMLCESMQLDPWAGDAYMVGYDTKDGPNFNRIVSIWALFKLAERHPQYDGMQSGLITADGDDVEGEYYTSDQTVTGAPSGGRTARCPRRTESD